MAARLWRIIMVLLLPVTLSSCVLVPAKFVSTLIINADRTFSFSYVGEVVALDIGDEMTKGLGAGFSPDETAPTPQDDGEAKPAMMQIGWQEATPDTMPRPM